MSDTIKAWYEMEEERKLAENAEQYNKEIMLASERAKYIFLLDFQMVKYIDMTLAYYVQKKINGILTQNLVNHFYMAQVTK